LTVPAFHLPPLFVGIWFILSLLAICLKEAPLFFSFIIKERASMGVLFSDGRERSASMRASCRAGTFMEE